MKRIGIALKELGYWIGAMAFIGLAGATFWTLSFLIKMLMK